MDVPHFTHPCIRGWACGLFPTCGCCEYQMLWTFMYESLCGRVSISLRQVHRSTSPGLRWALEGVKRMWEDRRGGTEAPQCGVQRSVTEQGRFSVSLGVWDSLAWLQPNPCWAGTLSLVAWAWCQGTRDLGASNKGCRRVRAASYVVGPGWGPLRCSGHVIANKGLSLARKCAEKTPRGTTARLRKHHNWVSVDSVVRPN